MQLDQFYLTIIQMSLHDAISLGAAAALLVGTFFGIKLKRLQADKFQWLFGGGAGAVFGTVFGYYIMNIIGYLVALSGSLFYGLSGADLIEWGDTITAVFAPYQMQAVGFALLGVLLGIGWGYGIGARPDDTSLIGNLVATIGLLAIVGGLICTTLTSFLLLTYDTAFLYLVILNGLVLIGYAIGYMVNQRRENLEATEILVEVEELIE